MLGLAYFYFVASGKIWLIFALALSALHRVHPVYIAFAVVGGAAFLQGWKARYPAPPAPPRPLEPWRDDLSVLDAPEAFGYSAFTREFDDEIAAEALVNGQELERLQGLLQDHIKEGDAAFAGSSVAGTPIAQTVSNSQISLLVDNSGSMRGRPILLLAGLLYRLVPMLEATGARVEVLGFSTSSWKGGQSREKWIAEGQLPNPGRLCDLRHIVYRRAEVPWSDSGQFMAVMLKEGILKENVDGDAIVWAYRRLMAQPADRRILVVISDGAPVDDSTLSANSGDYLERHLKHVVRDIERRGKLELRAIGIGHPVERYYQNTRTLAQPLATPEQVHELAAFITKPSGERAERQIG